MATEEQRRKWREQRRAREEKKRNLEQVQQPNPPILLHPKPQNPLPLPSLQQQEEMDLAASVGRSFSGSGANDQEAKDKSKSAKGREAEYITFFTNRFGPLVILLLWIVLSDFERAVFYAPTPDECRDIAPPMGRLLAKAKLPPLVHDGMLNSDSITAIGMTVVGYLDRIGVLEKLIPVLMTGGKKAVESAKQTSRSNEPIQAINPANAEGRVNGTNGHISLAGVTGIGATYSSD